MKIRSATAVLLVTVLALPTSMLAQVTDDAESIRRARAGSNDAIARHDVPGIQSLLEADYRASVSSGDFIDSPEAMGASFAAHFAEFEDALYVRTPESVEVSRSGPVASEVGHWVGTWTSSDGPYRVGGRYMAFWRKTSDGWLLHAELFVPLFCEGAGCHLLPEPPEEGETR